jgi:hypothetical protein
MKYLIKWVVVVSSAFLLIACSPPMPELELDSNQNAANKQHFKWEERKPLRKVKLAGDFFISKQLDSNLPEDKASEPIALRFPGRTATLGDIVFLLEQKGIPVSYNWTVYEDVAVSSFSGGGGGSGIDGEMDFGDEPESYSSSYSSTDASISSINSLENRSVPFKTYKGTLSGLLRRLEKSMNISYWWEDDTIFLSTNQEYVVSVPQQKDIIDSIVSEVESLGATNISSSLAAGQIVYYAKPRSQKNLIRPFLQRISHNLSEITLQVALVQVDITGSESKGFDWEVFNGIVTSPTSGTDNSSNVTVTPYDSASGTGNVTGSFFRKGISIFGTETDVTIDMAINILGSVGKVTTEQNVEMRTISGKEVTLESVSEESYVSGYEGGTSGDNPEPASPEFDTVETGLTLAFLPVFDAYNAIVTVDTSIDLSERLGDTTVTVINNNEASGDGNKGQEITVRPNIKKSSFEDIVRIPLGETVIVGGLSKDKLTDNRVAPLNMWDVNSSKQQSQKQALFMIIRPLVTLYETEGNEIAITEEDILQRTKYNYGQAIEKKKEDESKAKEAAEEKKATELAAAKSRVDQKAIELEKKKVARAKQEAEMKENMAKMRSELESKHKTEMLAKETEATKLQAEMEEHKRAREVLEAENQWIAPEEEEEAIEEEAIMETIKEEIKPTPTVAEDIVEETDEVEIPLSDEELKKIEMLNMLRGIKK